MGSKKTGKRVNDTKVICHERVNIAAATRIKLRRLLITPESVEVKACCGRGAAGTGDCAGAKSGRADEGAAAVALAGAAPAGAAQQIGSPDQLPPLACGQLLGGPRLGACCGARGAHTAAVERARRGGRCMALGDEPAAARMGGGQAQRGALGP